MKWFLNWLDQLGRRRIIYDRLDDEPYLERYYIFLKDRNKFPFKCAHNPQDSYPVP